MSNVVTFVRLFARAAGNFGAIPMLLLPSLCSEGNALHGEKGCDSGIGMIAIYCIVPTVGLATVFA